MVMMRPPSRRKGTAARTAATTPPTFTANSLERCAVGGLVVDGTCGEHARIVDEDVESAELLGYRLGKVSDLLGVGLICFERCGVNAFVLEVLGDGRRFVGGSGIADGDVSAARAPQAR